jgi:hypothetical protein
MVSRVCSSSISTPCLNTFFSINPSQIHPECFIMPRQFLPVRQPVGKFS